MTREIQFSPERIVPGMYAERYFGTVEASLPFGSTFDALLERLGRDAAGRSDKINWVIEFEIDIDPSGGPNGLRGRGTAAWLESRQ